MASEAPALVAQSAARAPTSTTLVPIEPTTLTPAPRFRRAAPTAALQPRLHSGCRRTLGSGGPTDGPGRAHFRTGDRIAVGERARCGRSPLRCRRARPAGSRIS